MHAYQIIDSICIQQRCMQIWDQQSCVEKRKSNVGVPGDSKKTDTTLLPQIGNISPLASNHSIQSYGNTTKDTFAALDVFRVLFQCKHNAFMNDLHKGVVIVFYSTPRLLSLQCLTHALCTYVREKRRRQKKRMQKNIPVRLHLHLHKVGRFVKSRMKWERYKFAKILWVWVLNVEPEIPKTDWDWVVFPRMQLI